MDYDDLKRVLWALAFVIWALVAAIVALAPEPQCITDMECELLHGPE